MQTKANALPTPADHEWLVTFDADELDYITAHFSCVDEDFRKLLRRTALTACVKNAVKRQATKDLANTAERELVFQLFDENPELTTDSVEDYVQWLIDHFPSTPARLRLLIQQF